MANAVLPKVSRCPHCSIARPLFSQCWFAHLQGGNGGSYQWAVFYCSNCTGLIAVRSQHNHHINLQHPDLMFPKPRAASEEIPDIARTFLQQAMDTLHAPDAAAVMAGSAVDAMLKAKGLTEGSVYKRIDQAVTQAILTAGMAEWAHAVRLGANRPRHADEKRPHVTPDEAAQAVKFAEALGEFLFVLTAQIERGVSAAGEAASE